MRLILTFSLCAAVLLAMPPPAGAWGAEGHLIINGDAARALPDSVPAFVRTPAAVAEIEALGPEADRLRDAGAPRDNDRDPAHFLDLDDDGTVAGAVPLANLPLSREAFDTALRGGHPIDGHPADQYKTGFLPYSIIDGWEQIVKDFAIWRVDTYGEAHATDPATRAAFGADRRLREILTLRDIGYWGHFVGDGSQPLHVSVHYNGWGNYPNPHGYTHATPALVQSRIGPYVPSTKPFPARVSAYLQATADGVPMLYQLEGAGAFDAGTPAAVNFVLDRLAAGAQMMRDSIADAYVAAADMRVGYPGALVRDVESGAAPAELPNPRG
jgi:hypothetical protein